MTLTPAALRLDLKCGKGAISPGEKCTKGAAQRVNPAPPGSPSRTPQVSKGLEKMPTKALKSHYNQLFDSLIKKYPGKVNNDNDFKKFRSWAAKQPENAEANAVQAILTRRRQRGQRITAGAAGVAAAGGLLLAGALTGRLRRDAAVFTDKKLHATVKAEARRKTDIWATGFDTEDGKKYTKVVTNPETGRKRRIRYGAKGYKIAPGTERGNNYCTRSFGDMKSHGKDCAGADRNTPLCLSRAKWRCSGKVSRTDAPKGAQGKPCGASHIPREYKCSKNTGPLTAGNLKTAAKVALAVGALAGGAYLTKRGMMSMDEWRKSPQSARNNPKLSPERAQQIADEAIAGGQKWDVQEKINARRQAELNTECGLGLGKVLAPAKFDALIPKPRCQAGEGAFGTYFVHPSEKYGVKLFRNGDEDDVGFEFDMLDRARAAGVNAPDPLSMNAVRDIDGEIRSQTLVLSHMKGYSTINSLGWSDGQGRASRAPLITKVKLAREFRKLHTEGLAHGDIHSGNIMASAVSKKPALIDFGYATNLDSYHPGHGRSGIQNLMVDLNRLPEFLGLPGNGKEFRARYKGVLDNIKTQATNWDMGVQRSQSWDRFEVGVKRYHDALERELLGQEGLNLPRSRFISSADQPRIPGLTRGILTANVNTAQREVVELLLARGDRPSFLKPMAKGLGVKPASLQRALQPERDARLAKQRRQPFGTPLAAPKPEPFVQKLNSVGVLRWVTNPAAPKAPAAPTPKPNKTPVGMFRVKPGTPTGMRRVKPGVDEFTGLTTSSAATRSPSRTPAARAPRNWPPAAKAPAPYVQKLNSAGVLRWVTKAPATPKARRAPLGSLSARAQSILDRSGNEDMSLEVAMRLARNEQRGFSSWKD